MDSIKIGNLISRTASKNSDLLAKPVSRYLSEHKDLDQFLGVVEIDSIISDTTSFCEAYKVTSAQAGNCVILKGVKNGQEIYTACLVLASTKADVNGVIKKHLDAQKLSFAPPDEAVKLTKMEFEAITPIGLPEDWVILIDSKVIETENIIIGSGIRKSKILIKGKALLSIKNAQIIKDIAKMR